MTRSDQIYNNVLLAMQDAEEIEGVEGVAYLDLMEAIRHEAQKRFDNYADTMDMEVMKWYQQFREMKMNIWQWI